VEAHDAARLAKPWQPSGIDIEADAFVSSSTMVISQAEAMPPSMT